MNKFILIVGLFFASFVVNAQPYGPFNQQFTYNQQYGSTNWYSSPLGMGAAQAGVLLMGGIVNMMSRPSTPQVQYAPQQQIQYVPAPQQQYYGYQPPVGGGFGGPIPYYGYGPQ